MGDSPFPLADQVYASKERYAEAIAALLEDSLRRGCGIFIDERRREKLLEFVEHEVL